MSEKFQLGFLPTRVHELRRRIDALDRDLVRLLNERSRCTVEIGRLKRQVDLPVHDPERESELRRQIAQMCGGPLAVEAMTRLFEHILEESRRLERLTNARPSDEEI